MKKCILFSIGFIISISITACSKNGSSCNCLSADGDTICKSEYESQATPDDETWEEFVAAEMADGATCN